MRAPGRLWWLAVVVVLVASTVVLRAQSKPWVDSSMTELVAEVRALRQTMERTTALTVRMQALVGRVQMLENRLAHLRQRLDDVRQRMRTSTSPAEVAQSRAEERELLASLAREEARWNTYSARLEAIEQEIARGGGRQP